ncbi:MAG: hypothetical protein J6Y07_03805 [Alphaproteobacteria bacterium]|nr:hypothetical protein [Alphaproteobacteria bacterium]
MKKFLLLLSILGLAACDRPTSNAELTCTVDKHWQRSNVLYLNNNYYDPAAREDTEIKVKIVTYDDYAKVTVDGVITTFEKVIERRDNGEFGYVSLTYKGNFPDSERTALLDIYGDITNKQILQYQLSFIGQKTKNDSGREFSMSHSCRPVKEEYKGKSWGAAVPFHHNYKMPNKIERCITDICKTVYCGDGTCTSLTILNDENGKEFPLSPQDALSLSRNWDYSNLKRYSNDGKLEDYEKDACEVLDKINKFIADHDLFFDAYKTIQDAMDNCGENCNRILTKGEKGDFLIQIPETKDLRKIATKQKNVKFLSIFNPNSHAKADYCLVNVIPYDTMKKLGTPDSDCHYRIYCGAPEHMNYNEPYAVEVCY